MDDGVLPRWPARDAGSVHAVHYIEAWMCMWRHLKKTEGGKRKRGSELSRDRRTSVRFLSLSSRLRYN
jgi:hypothetical protein